VVATRANTIGAVDQAFATIGLVEWHHQGLREELLIELTLKQVHAKMIERYAPGQPSKPCDLG
jgi:hypothetical protein